MRARSCNSSICFLGGFRFKHFLFNYKYLILTYHEVNFRRGEFLQNDRSWKLFHSHPIPTTNKRGTLLFGEISMQQVIWDRGRWTACHVFSLPKPLSFILIKRTVSHEGPKQRWVLCRDVREWAKMLLCTLIKVSQRRKIKRGINFPRVHISEK